MRVGAQTLDVRQDAGDEVIDADDFVATLEKAFAQVRTNEAGAAGNDRAQDKALAVCSARAPQGSRLNFDLRPFQGRQAAEAVFSRTPASAILPRSRAFSRDNGITIARFTAFPLPT